MDKSFDTLYAIAMSMADTCVINQSLEDSFTKLHEEYQELVEEFGETPFIPDPEKFKGELADVLFVLLHLAHKLGITPFELLHKASSKMLARMNDKSYIAKN